MKSDISGRKVKIIDGTPEIAERWLTENNLHNRPMRPGHAETLAAAMKKGEWVLTAEPIAFCHPYVDSNGNKMPVTLINGQHRLWAIVLSKTTVPLTVWWGCEPDEFQVIDQGRARTHGDIFSTTRPELADGSMAAGIISAFFLYGLGYGSEQGAVRHTHFELLLRQFPESVAATVGYRKGLKKMGPRHVISALFLCHLVNPGMADLIADQLKTAVGFTERDPIRALHAYLVQQIAGTAKDTVDAQFYKTCHAICARLRGEQLRTLRITGEGLGFLREGAKTKLEPVAREMFGKVPQYFYNPKLVMVRLKSVPVAA